MSKLSRLLVAANLIAIIAMAIWFRCRDLENLPDINGDEAWYGVQAESVLHGEPIDWRSGVADLAQWLAAERTREGVRREPAAVAS